MQKIKWHIWQWAGLLLFLVLIAGCDGGGGSRNPTGTATWNFLVYLDGDNSLGEYAALNFLQMQTVGSTAKVNVLVLYAQAGTPLPTVTLYRVVRDPTNSGNIVSPTVKSYGNAYMSNPQTLINFITDCSALYPAQHTVLTLWDHGGGVYPRSLTKSNVISVSPQKNNLKSICLDSSGNTLSTDDVANALVQAQSKTGKTIDIIHMDACLMQMLEVAYQWRNVTSYVVGSEESVPAPGNNYQAILNDLTQNSGMSPQALASTLVNEFYNYNNPYGIDTTYSAIQTSGFNSFIATFQTFASDLYNAWSSNNTSIYTCGTTCAFFGYSQNPDEDYTQYIDLASFAAMLATTSPSPISSSDANAMVKAVNSLVISHRGTGSFFGSAADPAKGLAINLPYDAYRFSLYGFYNSDLDLAKNTSWYLFMNEFAAYAGTGAITQKAAEYQQ